MKPDDDLQTALEIMQNNDYVAVTMVDSLGRPIGSITRDLATAKRGRCGDHFHGLRAIAQVDDDLRSVASAMFSKDTTWMPCVDHEGIFRGEISQRGVTHYLGATYRSREAQQSGIQHGEV